MTESPPAEVLFSVEGGCGRLRLNRPKVIHALNDRMVRTMTSALIAWESEAAVELVMVDHAGGRGFCAGGDVVAIAREVAENAAATEAFFRAEYQLNHLMFTYAKPGVAFLDGITMGGGVGIGRPWRYRVATERTLFAMPETSIGLLPDVGGGRYLSRLPGRIGQYLGLTGARLDGAECHALGIATHYVPSDALDRLKRDLCARPSEVEALLEAACITPPAARIMEHATHIARLFASDRLEEILAALSADESAFAQKQHAVLQTKAPVSCKATLRLLAEGAKIDDFAAEMRMEFDAVHRIFRRPDLAEGVRALLVDKDNAPCWNPATPEETSDALIDSIFAPLPEGVAWQPLPRSIGATG